MEREGRTGRRRITGRGAPVAVGHRAATGVLRGPNWFRAPRRRRSRGTGRPPASPAPGSIELATLIGRTQSIGVPCAGVDSVPRRDRLTAMARGAGHRRLASPAPARALRAAPCRAVVRGGARSYAEARGRTRRRAVVRGGARSYLRAPPRYDLAREGTTARIRVRPHGIRYDRTGLPWARVEPSRSFVYFHGETPARVSRGRGPGRLNGRSSPCRLACLPRARARVPVRTPLRRRRDRRLDHVHPRPPLQAPAGRGSGHAGSEFSGARLQPPAGRGSGRPSHRPGPPTAPRAHQDAEGARRP